MAKVKGDDLGQLVWCALSYDRRLPLGRVPPAVWAGGRRSPAGRTPVLTISGRRSAALMRRAGRMIMAVRPPAHCPGVAQRCPGPVPAGVRVVREEDALSLVADSALALAARGHCPVITDANSVRLVRLGALMLAEFGVAGPDDQTGREES